MKTITNFINEAAQKFEDAADYLNYLVKQSKEKHPPIWDDTCSWEARDSFEYWQSARGDFDDVLDFISEYADHKCVLGWATEISFEETEKLMPKRLKDIMKASKPKNPYKKHSSFMNVWETKDAGFNITILQFTNHANTGGTDYIEYWYMIAVEE